MGPKWKPAKRLDGWEPTCAMQPRFHLAILNSLTSVDFEEIENRENAIAKPYEDTYAWIFEVEPTKLDAEDLWSSFPAWLESGKNTPYGITGKPLGLESPPS